MLASGLVPKHTGVTCRPVRPERAPAPGRRPSRRPHPRAAAPARRSWRGRRGRPSTMRSRTASVAASGPVCSGCAARHATIRCTAREKVSPGAYAGTKRRILLVVEDRAVRRCRRASRRTRTSPGRPRVAARTARARAAAATPERLRDDRVDLVPGVDVVAGDVEGLADRPRVAEQADEALRRSPRRGSASTATCRRRARRSRRRGRSGRRPSSRPAAAGWRRRRCARAARS